MPRGTTNVCRAKCAVADTLRALRFGVHLAILHVLRNQYGVKSCQIASMVFDRVCVTLKRLKEMVSGVCPCC